MHNVGRFMPDTWWDLYEPYDDLANIIMDIGDPIAVVFGTFGNVMIILIMLRLPSSTSSVFFIALAVCDQLGLIAALQNFIEFMFTFTFIRDQGTWQCKIFRFIEFVFPPLSSWMLVSLTVLRAASVLWPLRVSAVWIKRKSRSTAAIMTSVLILLNAHYLYGFNMWKNKCSITASERYDWFVFTIDTFIYLLQFCFLPFIILVVSNSVLLWTLARTVRENKHLSAQQTSQDSRQQKVSSLTVTLIAASVSFFLLTTPISIFWILEGYTDWSDPIHSGQVKVFSLTSSVLFRFNISINFYMYCLTGTKFRAEFVKIMQEVHSIFCETKRVSSGQGSSKYAGKGSEVIAELGQS